MVIHTPITTACGKCGTSLDSAPPIPDRIARRAARYGAVCERCQELLWLDWEQAFNTNPGRGRIGTCDECNGTGKGKGEYHYVRGEKIRNDCDKCNGTGDA